MTQKLEIINHNRQLIDDILAKAVNRSKQIVYDNQPENSKKALVGDMAYMAGWYEANFIPWGEVRKEHILLFVIQHVEGPPLYVDNLLVGAKIKAKLGPHKIATIERKIASLSHMLNLYKMHNPCYDPDVMELIRSYTNIVGGSQSVGDAITVEELNKLIKACDDGKTIGIRDAAMFLFGFASGGRRRSEICDAMVDQLKRQSDGNYIFMMGRSKSNQAGKLDAKPIAGRAAMALNYWLDVGNIRSGHIFRKIRKGGLITDKGLEGKDVFRIVKHRCQLAGLDPDRYTPHSLRSGFVTEAAKRSKPIFDVMEMTGHTSVKQLMQYYKPGNVLHNSAAYLAG